MLDAPTTRPWLVTAAATPDIDAARALLLWAAAGNAPDVVDAVLDTHPTLLADDPAARDALAGIRTVTATLLRLRDDTVDDAVVADIVAQDRRSAVVHAALDHPNAGPATWSAVHATLAGPPVRRTARLRLSVAVRDDCPSHVVDALAGPVIHARHTLGVARYCYAAASRRARWQEELFGPAWRTYTWSNRVLADPAVDLVSLLRDAMAAGRQPIDRTLMSGQIADVTPARRDAIRDAVLAVISDPGNWPEGDAGPQVRLAAGAATAAAVGWDDLPDVPHLTHLRRHLAAHTPTDRIGDWIRSGGDPAAVLTLTCGCPDGPFAATMERVVAVLGATDPARDATLVAALRGAVGPRDAQRVADRLPSTRITGPLRTWLQAAGATRPFAALEQLTSTLSPPRGQRGSRLRDRAVATSLWDAAGGDVATLVALQQWADRHPQMSADEVVLTYRAIT